jgi:hypothetical protein
MAFLKVTLKTLLTSDTGTRRIAQLRACKYINEFERFLHHHVIKTGSIMFQLDVPDPLLVQMLQDTRMTYLQQPSRPVLIHKLMHIAC